MQTPLFSEREFVLRILSTFRIKFSGTVHLYEYMFIRHFIIFLAGTKGSVCMVHSAVTSLLLFSMFLGDHTWLTMLSPSPVQRATWPANIKDGPKNGGDLTCRQSS